MARIYQAFEFLRSSIIRLGGKEVGAIVAPIANAWALSYGHQFNRRDANGLAKIGKRVDDRIKCSLRCKGAHVEFINNTLFEWQAFPILIIPGKGRWINHHRRSMDTIGLESGGRVRTFKMLIDDETIE